jgi:hypothetical protein
LYLLLRVLQGRIQAFTQSPAVVRSQPGGAMTDHPVSLLLYVLFVLQGGVQAFTQSPAVVQPQAGKNFD